MAATPLTRITATSATEIVDQAAEMSEAARALLPGHPKPADFLQALLQRSLHTDAVRFLALALPKRRAVWWACLAAREALDESSPPAFAETLAAAEAWVYRPTDENRRNAQKQAEAIQFAHPVAFAAMAAFFADGSMAPPGIAEVKPADHISGTTVANAVILTAVKEPQRAAERYDELLRRGMDIASGGDGRPQGGARTG